MIDGVERHRNQSLKTTLAERVTWIEALNIRTIQLCPAAIAVRLYCHTRRSGISALPRGTDSGEFVICTSAQ